VGVKMKDALFRVLDPEDDEFAKMLMELGVKKNVAKILAYMKNQREVTSRDLELGSGLRQPEVSLAMRELREMGWVSEREMKKPGKGRPYKMYTLEKPIREIIEELEEEKRKESQIVMENIQRLKELVK